MSEWPEQRQVVRLLASENEKCEFVFAVENLKDQEILLHNDMIQGDI